jgi:hypothetical protein
LGVLRTHVSEARPIRRAQGRFWTRFGGGMSGCGAPAGGLYPTHRKSAMDGPPAGSGQVLDPLWWWDERMWGTRRRAVPHPSQERDGWATRAMDGPPAGQVRHPLWWWDERMWGARRRAVPHPSQERDGWATRARARWMGHPRDGWATRGTRAGSKPALVEGWGCGPPAQVSPVA